ncbi:CBS domain-containing protein [Streptomyces sp. CC228A]|uniref:CBS domain-containing protein n=1 Tax=Streptomyces sp. CC228A TaxID=2898186 RepID=UPI001F388057|nr:CBS domain-containing protein [Streptomyces sp. CC228A]
MRASDLAEPYPVVGTDDDAEEAARLFAEQQLPALLVVDRDGGPYAIVPGSQLLRVIVPEHALREPALARALRDDDGERLQDVLEGLTVAEWLSVRGPRELPAVVGVSAGAIEVAALMVRTHTPLVAVVESDGDRTRTVGAIRAAHLMAYFLNRP